MDMGRRGSGAYRGQDPHASSSPEYERDPSQDSPR
jgi:hypothetical protein